MVKLLENPIENETRLANESRALEAPISRLGTTDILATVCPVLGCVGWCGLAIGLQNYQQSEQLARFFTALVNMFVYGAIGGPSLVLCLLGLRWSKNTSNRESYRTQPIGKMAAKIGLVIALIVSLVHLPRFIWYLG